MWLFAMFRLVALAGLLRPLAGVEVPFSLCEGVADELAVSSLRLSPARLDGADSRLRHCAATAEGLYSDDDRKLLEGLAAAAHAAVDADRKSVV